MQNYDVIIIGGGVVGSAIARELMRYKLSLAVLEKESDVCVHSSGRNTGMLHAGFLYKTGSLKAQCAVEGNAEFDTVAKELDIPFKRTGKLVVGFTSEHHERLLQIIKRGHTNGVPHMEMIDRKRMDELDPSAGGNFAIYCPSSGILDPFIYTIALAENAVLNGANYHLNTELISAERLNNKHILHTNNGDFSCRWVINSAGLNSAKVSEMFGVLGHCIQAVKGEYFVLDKKAGQFATIPIYPAPTAQNTFDIHATPTIDGNILVGPNSFNVENGEDYSVSKLGMQELQYMGSKMFKHMKPEYYIRSFSGARAKRVHSKTREVLDFLIEYKENCPGLINLIGIESPGLTSALPLARRVIKLILDHEKLCPNTSFNPIRNGFKRFSNINKEDIANLIAQNTDYGELICRCESVTLAEIMAAIKNSLGVCTLNGIKLRTRASMGRCQGGYCETRIVELILKELKKPLNDVELGSYGSYMFTGHVKEADK